MDANNKETDFGFKKIKASEKEKLVGKVFSSVADKYDLMNDVMSLGIHRYWKMRFVEYLTKLDAKIIDVAGGTGDIALKIMQQARSKGASPEVHVVDINYEMLKVGQDKAIDNNILKNISFSQANAEHLPFADNSFDYYTVAFGIRNMTNLDVVLKEAKRVLKPGGKFLCLEFSHVDFPLFKPFYDFYSFNVIPNMGNLIAGDKESYQYLVESIRKFPLQDEFASKISACGFQNARFENLNFGICAIHSAEKI
ncbi:MAG: Ubiquinone/menaquinone biosynthesis methyltransferase UbiE [Rickettsiaceae bacterium]|jgi:demethylmenaquinone methyltransferase/2-methoxy-6-polyprenyl-1,4-benzoquinol methylase|nr:Ubiquinone/menaquinone biosynthesis methyltransferase UbiE [Rickettsiaceae bacterium]